MDCFEVNAVNYGAPQLRERVEHFGEQLQRRLAEGPSASAEDLASYRSLALYLLYLRHEDGWYDLIEADTARNLSPELEAVLRSLIGVNLSHAAQLQIPERAQTKLRAFLQSYFVEHLPGMTGRSMRSGRVFSSL